MAIRMMSNVQHCWDIAMYEIVLGPLTYLLGSAQVENAMPQGGFKDHPRI